MNVDFAFVIVGGGILGSALAAFAARAGYEPLVLRLSDAGAPQADTLRNQGWLQSGVMYKVKDFASPADYAAFAEQTYEAGKELIQECGLELREPPGILRASEPFHLERLEEKRKLLRLSHPGFIQLAPSDAKELLGRYHEANSTYFRIPDRPFDEAAVVTYFRKRAVEDGAVFVEVNEPARLEVSGSGVRISFDGREIETPILVVAAGAGSFGLMKQCQVEMSGHLQRTPLMVGEAPDDMPAPIMVDLDRGFSAVRHRRGQLDEAAVVMGTRVKTPKAPDPAERLVPKDDQVGFSLNVPPGFRTCLDAGRYTAGYEVMPPINGHLSPFHPWIEVHGPVIFASPGRATIAGLSAAKVYREVLGLQVRSSTKRTSKFDISGCTHWGCAVEMHYMPTYTYNDAEIGHV
jgi:glycine/D-amino acid oxidase-like deaminating enzyme